MKLVSLPKRVMLVIGLGVGLIAGGVTLGTPAGSATAAACVPGIKTVGGYRVRAFCGPARATVSVGGKTYRFANGRCTPAGIYEVNIGTTSLPSGGPPRRHFGASTPMGGDGTYATRLVIVAWQIPGNVFSLVTGKVTIAGKGKRGSFSGTAERSGLAGFGRQRASGSWTC